jgi:xanthine dehydrogenase YagS FAD-binding subunit
VADARIALGGVAHKPWRPQEAERWLQGKPANVGSFRNAADLSLHGAAGSKSNEFKIQLAKRSLVRVLTELSASA